MSFTIAFTGPESTGKSSLSELVAEKLNGIYVPEFSRGFLENTNGHYEEKDLDEIAMGQYQSTQKWIEAGVPFIVSDTDMTVMKVWSSFKYGRVSELIEGLYASEVFDHLFLCDIDIPWEEDPLREHPEKRAELFEIYVDLIRTKTKNYTVVKGSLEERLKQVKEVLQEKYSKTLGIPK
jgi:nicotinamide riboside kinase